MTSGKHTINTEDKICDCIRNSMQELRSGYWIIVETQKLGDDRNLGWVNKDVNSTAPQRKTSISTGSTIEQRNLWAAMLIHGSLILVFYW